MPKSSSYVPRISEWCANAYAEEYCVFIAAIGYESRARFAASEYSKHATHRFAIGFDYQHVLAYDDNKRWFEEHGFKTAEVSDAAYRETIETILSGLDNCHRIVLDITSLNRTRMAHLVDIFRARPRSDQTIDFVYSMAKFSGPSDVPTMNNHVGPVLPSFSGWTIDSQNPSVAVVGVGYEQDKALGAIEHLQANDIWCFVPESSIPEYTEALRKANRLLFEAIPTSRMITYRVDKTLDTFALLESLINRLKRFSSPVILPFGPKIFSIMSLWVASIHGDTAVWRVSSGQDLEPEDRKPNGEIFGLAVKFFEESADDGLAM